MSDLSEGSAPAPAPQMFRGKMLFWVPWPLLVALDLWSKSAVFGFMAESYPLVPEPYPSTSSSTGRCGLSW